MIVVEGTLLFTRRTTGNSQMMSLLFESLGQQDAATWWHQHKFEALEVDHTLEGGALIPMKRVFDDWVAAPVQVELQKRTYYVSTDPLYGPKSGSFHGVFESVQQNTQYKVFKDRPSLFRALIGHVYAIEARGREERLALSVLSQFRYYEGWFLDDLVYLMHNAVRSKGGSFYGKRGESAYGPSATVDWGASNLVVAMDDDAGIVRLYRKIAALHDFAKFMGVSPPNRSKHESQRMKGQKYSLNEDHPQIISDRRQGISVWAGQSGSTMDMIYAAMTLLDLTNPHELTLLAYCIAAFFNYMPTTRSSTHTFHEVMRGAKSICPEIEYNPVVAKVPTTPPPLFLSKL